MDHSSSRGQYHVATVGMGSNLGDRKAFLLSAMEQLTVPAGNRLLEVSSIYETEPFGEEDQDSFLNCVVQVETRQDMKSFFGFLRETEDRHGRKREKRWGPRTLDLDLLFFDNVIFSDHELVVPHSGIAERRFVLEPLCEIAPGLIHPSHRKTVRELLEENEDPLRVIRLEGVPDQKG